MPENKPSETDADKIDKVIASNLEQYYEVPVIIVLNIGDSEKIRSAQDAFLDSLTPADFKLKTRFDSMPGLAGWITKIGLDKMKNDPRIKSIKSDSLSSPTE